MTKFFMGVAAAVALTACFTGAAFAATITEVEFYSTFDENDEASTGATDLDFGVYGDKCDLVYERTSSATTGKSEATYKLTFYANSGYEFPSSASSINIKGIGVSSITSSSVKDSGDTLEVKVKAYQLVKLEEPEITGDYDGSKMTWTSDTSGTFEYYIVYTDFNGDTKEKHGTTTSKSVAISTYNKEYTGSADGYDNREITGFWVRQKSMSSSSNPYVVPSDWAGSGEEPSGEMLNYETWGDYLTEDHSSVTQGSTGSTSSSGTSGPSGISYAHWSGSNDSGWYYYYVDGNLATGWIYTGDRWYYLDPANGGKMVTGWLLYNNQWYYLNPSTTEGIYGEMITGWKNVGGNWYYMRPAGTDGIEGSMYENTSVYIGSKLYTFDQNGVCTNY